jgi:IclR family acetate operon transcriptional repressor
MTAHSGEGTAALDKALDILDAVGAAANGISQAELAQRLALPRTTLYRLLATLVARGMLRRDPQRRVYALGFRCFELARSAYAMPDLAAAAGAELRALRDLTGETTYLATLDGLEVISLERMDGAHSQRSNSALGQRKPLHCTSQGKAILAALDETRRDALVRDITLKAVTPRSITDRRRLQAELRATAARGYAIDDEEIVPGVRCVGAAIVDAAGEVRGAISVAGPAWRMTPGRLDNLGPEVADAARRIGAQLGPALGGPPVAAAVAVDGPWAFHGAFACWSAAHQALFWVDAMAPSVRVLQGATDRELLALDAPVTGLALAGADALWVACAAGVQRIALQGDPWQPEPAGLLPWQCAEPTALCADATGQLWVCLPEREGGWSVARWWPDSPPQVQWRLGEPLQALAWSPDGSRLAGVVADSGALLWMTPGEPTLRRLATVPKGSGRPSGLCVDAQGGVWTALRDGWSAVRFGPDGALDRVVSVPVPVPTDVAVCGDAPATVLVTSARQPVAVDALANAPLSGRLFRISLA